VSSSSDGGGGVCVIVVCLTAWTAVARDRSGEDRRRPALCEVSSRYLVLLMVPGTEASCPDGGADRFATTSDRGCPVFDVGAARFT
jgi:hypothetical protein